MKKVLILSYFFPPCNLTASGRISSWQQYLPLNGIYPIIITRNWTGSEKNDSDRLESSGTVEKHLKLNDSEVYYLPYKASRRDVAFVKGQQSFFYKILSKILTFSNLWLQNIFVKTIPYYNIYVKAKEVLRNDSTIQTLIISTNPFEQFYFGYLLKKEFPNLTWIADYRDDWTTNELKEKNSILAKALNKYHQYFEKKWLKKASIITSVSELYVNKLSKLHQKNTQLIMNGFKDNIESISPKVGFKNFTIIYSGTIYEKQNFDFFFQSVFNLCNEKNTEQIDVLFIGSNESLPSGFFDKFLKLKPENLNIEITNRVSWEESIAYLKAADLLFLSSYGNVKGIPTSKLYDYIACQKPILLCPSDQDIMQKIIKETETGKACVNNEEAYNFIKLVYEKSYNHKPNLSNIAQYATKNQVAKLAELIKSDLLIN